MTQELESKKIAILRNLIAALITQEWAEDFDVLTAQVSDLKAENQRMRELLVRATKVLGGLGPGALLADIEAFLAEV